jgi:hypothetical protein
MKARRLIAARMFAIGTIAVAALTGCGSSAKSTTPAASSTTTEPSTPPSKTSTGAKPLVATDLRGRRYCEVLLIRVNNGNGVADVYNSYPLNTCPEALWTKLVPADLAKQNGFPIALLNGPRYWLMDTIEKEPSNADLHKTFGGIEMVRRASLSVGPLALAAKKYTLHNVNRRTVFTFEAGRTVYELTAPDGTKYVMQSWSQETDPTLEEADLVDLGARLHPPTGWRYSCRKLSKPLRVVTTSADAHVLQDDFGNSYSLETGG